MAKQNGPETDGTPALKSVTGRTVWDFATDIATTLGPLFLLVAVAVFAYFKFLEQSYQNEAALREGQTAAMRAQHEAVRDSQRMLTEAHETTQGSYQSISAMNASMMSTIDGALNALKTVQDQSDQKVKSANDEIQVINEQLAAQKERAEAELTRIQTEVATANSAKAEALARSVQAQGNADAAQRRQIAADQKLARAKQEFEKTKEAVVEAKKVRIEKKARLKEDVGRLTELIDQLAKNNPPACEAPVAVIVEMAEEIRRNHLVDPAALLAAVGANPTRDTMVQLADLESVPTAWIREAIDAGIPGFDAWYHFAEEEIYFGVRRTDDYSLSMLQIYLAAGRVYSVDVDDYVEFTMCTIPSPANWDDSLPMVIVNELSQDAAEVSIVDEPSVELVNTLKDGTWSVELLIKTFDVTLLGLELINGQPITAKALDLATLWATQPATARKGLETSREFARVDAMRRNAESFSGRLLVPVGFFEGLEDAERLREDTVRILNAAVIKKSDRAELGASDLDPEAWGRLAAVVLSRGFRFERLEAGSNEVSIELQYLGEWEDSLGASVRLYRPEGTQSRTWQLADLTTGIPRSELMMQQTSQQAMPEQRSRIVPNSVP